MRAGTGTNPLRLLCVCLVRVGVFLALSQESKCCESFSFDSALMLNHIITTKTATDAQFSLPSLYF